MNNHKIHLHCIKTPSKYICPGFFQNCGKTLNIRQKIVWLDMLSLPKPSNFIQTLFVMFVTFCKSGYTPLSLNDIIWQAPTPPPLRWKHGSGEKMIFFYENKVFCENLVLCKGMGFGKNMIFWWKHGFGETWFLVRTWILVKKCFLFKKMFFFVKLWFLWKSLVWSSLIWSGHLFYWLSIPREMQDEPNWLIPNFDHYNENRLQMTTDYRLFFGRLHIEGSLWDGLWYDACSVMKVIITIVKFPGLTLLSSSHGSRSTQCNLVYAGSCLLWQFYFTACFDHFCETLNQRNTYN